MGFGGGAGEGVGYDLSMCSELCRDGETDPFCLDDLKHNPGIQILFLLPSSSQSTFRLVTDFRAS